MEAMRARSKSGSTAEVKVVESSSFNYEIFSSRRNDSVWATITAVVCLTYNQSLINLSPFSDHFTCQGEFDSRQLIISCLEVVEMYVTDSLSNSSVSVILPPDKVVEVSRNWRIHPIWIIRGGWVKHHSSTREHSWHHIMEDS